MKISTQQFLICNKPSLCVTFNHNLACCLSLWLLNICVLPLATSNLQGCQKVLNIIRRLSCQSKRPAQGYFIWKTSSVKKCLAEYSRPILTKQAAIFAGSQLILTTLLLQGKKGKKKQKNYLTVQSPTKLLDIPSNLKALQ